MFGRPPHGRLLIANLLAIALLLLPRPSVTRASGLQPAEKVGIWKLPSLAGPETLRLEGYRPTAALKLVIPAGWQPSRDGQLTLYYRVSQLAQAAATLTVGINGRALSSMTLPAELGSLVVSLPASLIQPGDNRIDLTAFLPLPDDERCILPNYSARWVEFGPESEIRLSVAPAMLPLDLAELPHYFEAVGDDPGYQITFVLPDRPDDHELSALSAAAFVLARTTTRPSWALAHASSFRPDQVNGPVVLIGPPGRNPHLAALAPSGSAAAGWLQLVRPAWSKGYPALTIGGTNSQTVVQAANALTHPGVLLQGATTLVTNLPPVASSTLADTIRLLDLGYAERTVRGTGTQELTYSFDLPFAWSPQDGRLQLHFVHSALVDRDVAALTVFLNGLTLSGVQMNARERASNIVDIPIDRSLLRPGRNFLRLSFNFGEPRDLCGFDVNEGFWATVRPDTALTLPHGNSGGRLDLRDFPYPFASESDLRVVLPLGMTTPDIEDGLNLIRSLGAASRQAHAAPRLVRAETLTDDRPASHLIITGDVVRQPLLVRLNAQVPLPFDLKTGTVLPTRGIHVPTNAPDLGVIQLLRSPWAANRVIVVVTGTSPAGYRAGLRSLIDPALWPQLAGQLVIVVTGSGSQILRTFSQPVADVQAVPIVGVVDRSLGNRWEPVMNSPWFTIGVVILTLLILAGLTILVLRWRRRHGAAQPPGH